MVPRAPPEVQSDASLQKIDSVNPRSDNMKKRGKKRARPADTDEEDVQMTEPVTTERASRRKVRRMNVEEISADEDPEDAINVDSDQGSAYDPQEHDEGHESPRISNTRIKQESEDVSLHTSTTGGFTNPIDIDEEEKPKMSMYLSYQGSHLPGRYLCVIAEPYPPLPPEQIPREATVEPPEVRFQVEPAVPQLQLRDSSRAPSLHPESIRARSETPLFLPDDDDYRVPARNTVPSQAQPRTFPPVPLFNQRDDEEDDDDKEEGDVRLLAFSQAMAGVGHEEGGEDSDEDYLRGDADEALRVIE